jgi:1-acyl-sn-glycerol-3-phosphate acyltransferase
MAAMKRDRFTSRPRAAARFVAQRLILKPAVWSAVQVQIIGTERLKGFDGPYVAVANHSSHLDAPMVMCGLPWRLARHISTGVAADYFFDVWWRRGLTKLFFNAFAIEREGGQRRGASAKGLLGRGVSLLVFPEATRGRDSGRTVRAFNPGAAAIAKSAGAPVLPIALIGTGMAHPKGSKWPGPGRLPVAIVFGEPMVAGDDESSPDFMDRIRTRIIELIGEHSPAVLGEPQLLEPDGRRPGSPSNEGEK